ncbi:class I SAM-dependent methyltransferase [Shouchella patagoniensis]|uniref:class I SAM-dependent methyltransferase n=1 Tax=Shouchella patagoniensis TaxID=228576 RepID=UPI000994FE64|nr:class I SAM-dependent methyltransferase [Shouchella patagoniensis]
MKTNLHIFFIIRLKGSWLHQPAKTVIDSLAYFPADAPLRVLDLGCGVGRNGIPIAKKMPQSTIVCVDLLESAINQLKNYCKRFHVERQMEFIQSDISDYNIKRNAFDYIVAVSSLEHVASKLILIDVLQALKQGTKAGGINCFIMNSNVEEVVLKTGKKIEPCMEVNLSTGALLTILRHVYSDWEGTRCST